MSFSPAVTAQGHAILNQDERVKGARTIWMEFEQFLEQHNGIYALYTCCVYRHIRCPLRVRALVRMMRT